MWTLNDAEFLGLWESGSRLHPLDRALLTLAAALPEVTGERLADWPIGRRNQALAKLCRHGFGPRLRGRLACIQCGEKLEFEMNTGLLEGEQVEESDHVDHQVTVNGWVFRLPTSRDLAKVANEVDVKKAAARIAGSCLVDGSPPAEWSEEDLSAIGEKLAVADPLAEMRLAFHCPDCGKDWEETLDLVSFIWAEIEARARQVMFAIHTLASAYGWTEAEILSLSDDRRALYLEMVQS